MVSSAFQGSWHLAASSFGAGSGQHSHSLVCKWQCFRCAFSYLGLLEVAMLWTHRHKVLPLSLSFLATFLPLLFPIISPSPLRQWCTHGRPCWPGQLTCMLASQIPSGVLKRCHCIPHMSPSVKEAKLSATVMVGVRQGWVRSPTTSWLSGGTEVHML